MGHRHATLTDITHHVLVVLRQVAISCGFAVVHVEISALGESIPVDNDADKHIGYLGDGCDRKKHPRQFLFSKLPAMKIIRLLSPPLRNHSIECLRV